MDEFYDPQQINDKQYLTWIFDLIDPPSTEAGIGIISKRLKTPYHTVVFSDPQRSFQFISAWVKIKKKASWSCGRYNTDLIFFFQDPDDMMLFKLMW